MNARQTPVWTSIFAAAALGAPAAAQCTPGAPTGVRATDGTRCVGVDVTWNEPSGTVLWYNVYRGTSSSNATNLIAAPTVPRYVDLTAGTSTWYYRVKAVGPCGSSGYSGANSGYAGLRKPTGLAATYGTDCQRVEITWNTVTGATLYEVRRNVEPVFETSILAGTSAIGQLRDLLVPAGQEWHYWVIARGTCSSEPAGPVVGVRGRAPAQPVVQATTDECEWGIRLSWGAEPLGTVTPVTYTIRRSTEDAFLRSEVIASGLVNRTYLDTEAWWMQRFYYWVVAQNPCGAAVNTEAASGQITNRVTLTADPFSLAVPVGGRAVLRASVSGGPTPPAWVWTHSVLGVLENGGNIRGADGPVLTIDPVRRENAGMYFVMAETCLGSQTASSYLHVPDSAGCYADCDTSSGPGVLDIFDFLCFQNRYDAADPYACDCDTSSGLATCDIFDFLCFQNAYDAGCP